MADCRSSLFPLERRSQADKVGANIMSVYTEQAESFLSNHSLRFRATRARNQTAPPWAESGERHGIKYRVTITRKGKPGRLSFDFWNSIAAMEKGETPSAYDVLACISGDVYCPDTFADFCAEYGYDEDSRKAEQTFKRCRKFADRINAFFAPEEIERLSEIQ